MCIDWEGERGDSVAVSLMTVVVLKEKLNVERKVACRTSSQRTVHEQGAAWKQLWEKQIYLLLKLVSLVQQRRGREGEMKKLLWILA